MHANIFSALPHKGEVNEVGQEKYRYSICIEGSLNLQAPIIILCDPAYDGSWTEKNQLKKLINNSLP